MSSEATVDGCKHQLFSVVHKKVCAGTWYEGLDDQLWMYSAFWPNTGNPSPVCLGSSFFSRENGGVRDHCICLGWMTIEPLTLSSAHDFSYRGSVVKSSIFVMLGWDGQWCTKNMEGVHLCNALQVYAAYGRRQQWWLGPDKGGKPPGRARISSL